MLSQHWLWSTCFKTFLSCDLWQTLFCIEMKTQFDWLFSLDCAINKNWWTVLTNWNKKSLDTSSFRLEWLSSLNGTVFQPAVALSLDYYNFDLHCWELTIVFSFVELCFGETFIYVKVIYWFWFCYCLCFCVLTLNPFLSLLIFPTLFLSSDDWIFLSTLFLCSVLLVSWFCDFVTGLMSPDFTLYSLCKGRSPHVTVLYLLINAAVFRACPLGCGFAVVAGGGPILEVRSISCKAGPPGLGDFCPYLGL